MAKVIKMFQDKKTKNIYKVGDSYEHKDAKRIAFLVKERYLEGHLEEDKKEEKKEEDPK